MKYFRYLTVKQAKALEDEVVSIDLKVYLTRLLHDHIATDADGDPALSHLINRQNILINQALNLQNQPIYVLHSDDDGMYHAAEHAWHQGEFQLIFRRLDTPQFTELLGDLISQQVFSISSINKLLERDGASFRYTKESGRLKVEVLKLNEIEESLSALEKDENAPTPHANIRLLLSRADDAIKKGDHAQVIHSCASVFETLAKDVLDAPSVDNEPLGGFFQKYRKESSLPPPVLDFILDQYNLRNRAPLAGHGSRLAPPTMTDAQAIALVEMTRAFVKVEYRLLISEDRKHSSARKETKK